MTILLPLEARQNVIDAILRLLDITTLPKLSRPEIESVIAHFAYLRNCGKDLEITVKLASAEVIQRTILNITIDLKDKVNVGPETN